MLFLPGHPGKHSSGGALPHGGSECAAGSGHLGEGRGAEVGMVGMKLSPRAQAESQGGRGPAGRDGGLPTS